MSKKKKESPPEYEDEYVKKEYRENDNRRLGALGKVEMKEELEKRRAREGEEMEQKVRKNEKYYDKKYASRWNRNVILAKDKYLGQNSIERWQRDIAQNTKRREKREAIHVFKEEISEFYRGK